ncbi:MAG: hypothetical protein AAF485_01830 [Chloroflexota bacterium]
MKSVMTTYLNTPLLYIGLATLLIGAGYAFSPINEATLFILLGGASWFLSQQRGWTTTLSTFGFIGSMGAALLAVWQGASVILMLFGVVAALVAWHLSSFTQRLDQATYIHNETGLLYAHQQRLGVVAGISLLLGIVTLSLQFRLTLGWAMLLAILMMIGLNRLIALIRKSTEGSDNQDVYLRSNQDTTG